MLGGKEETGSRFVSRYSKAQNHRNLSPVAKFREARKGEQ